MTTEEAERIAVRLGWKDREDYNDLTRRGLAVYEAKLKARLEPAHNNEFIAIEPNTEEYAIADSTGNAMRAIRKRQVVGPLLLMKIGPEPEYGLIARFLAADMLMGSQPK